MVLNRFFINILIRVIFIAVSSVVVGVVLQHLDHGYYYTLSGMIFLIVLQTWMLVNQVNKTNTDLERFFSSVGNHDSSIRFSDKAKNSSFRKLHDKMNSVNAIIHNGNIEIERKGHFLQSIVDHVDVGLLAFDMNGRVEIYNRAAKKYLAAQELRQISALKIRNEEIHDIINRIKPGEEILHKIIINNLLQSILIRATELKFENNGIKLVSFQDITNELDKKEIDSWQKLIRVLTHEIMNSISPITSLTKVISGYFLNPGNKKIIPSEKIDDLIVSKTLSGLNIIEETGSGLLDFVDKYRSLTSLPKPNLTRFTIDSLFRNCKLLMESNIPDGIVIITSVSPVDIEIPADYSQIEQVLINLIKNSTEALTGRNNGKIVLNACHENEDVIIQVEDNGIGIPGDIIEDIFVPFYTTKKNGSGIGLSISKQIMRAHGGNLEVKSAPGKNTAFNMRFPDTKKAVDKRLGDQTY